MGRGRRRSSSWPPATNAALLLLCFFHSVAAARLLPLQPAVVPPQVLHQAENNVVKAAAAADGLVVHEAEAAGNGDELFISEMTGAEADAAAAVCEGENDECLERRLLGDAHLDYIYTQHKGKP